MDLKRAGQSLSLPKLAERIDALERLLRGADQNKRIDPVVLDRAKLFKLITGSFQTETEGIEPGAVTESRLAAAVRGLMWRPGMVVAVAAATPDDGFLLCDGAAVSRTTYLALFTRIGTVYGVGDGTTTFNLPDFRGRVPVGVDGAAARMATNDALGQSGGAETHTLTIAQMPSHNHPMNSTPGGAAGAPFAVGPEFVGTQNNAAWNTGLQGGGGAHNNMQPYQVVNYQIKT